MKKLTGFFLALSIATVFGASDTWSDDRSAAYPSTPDSSMTPGDVCHHPDEYRYPEKIPYCKRNVSTSTKNSIIQDYDQHFGFKIQQMNRQDFKIDHLIPLCMGGSNSPENLWPQHKSIYAFTDPIEPQLCDLMAQGKILQKDAIEIIRKLKQNPHSAKQIQASLNDYNSKKPAPPIE